MGFFKKKKSVDSNTSCTTIPLDLDSIVERGAWLGMAYLKASGEELQILMKLCNLPKLPKQVQNRIRVEMAVFSLSKSTEIIEPLLRERCTKLPSETVSQIKKNLLDSAWQMISCLLIPPDLNDMTEAYANYITEKDRVAFFWKRLIKHGMNIETDKMKLDLSRFEQTVLHGTALFLTLDSISISQDQVKHDHDSFLKDSD